MPPESSSERRQKLLLFDIDGTLISTGGAGLSALRAAFLESFELNERAHEMPALDLAGSTDSGIVRSLCDHFGFDNEAEGERIEIFYSDYLVRLRDNLNGSHGDEGHVLPGLPALIEQLREQTDHALGLLTGNIARGAYLKVEHFGFAGVFDFGAFGDDHHDRNRLGPIAVQRASHHTGKAFEPHNVVIIGDTPKDIACARACGAVAVAVATGRFSADELEAHDPDHLFDDFVDGDSVIERLDLAT